MLLVNIFHFSCEFEFSYTDLFPSSRVKKWIPAIREQWITLKTSAEPHVHMLTTKTLEIYEVSKNTVTPRIIQVQEIADPYFQVRSLSTEI